MFEGEAHRSYVQLCRELRLQRERVEPGDLALVAYGPDRPAVADPGAWNHVPSGFTAHGGRYREGDVWLPRLDQWVQLLAEAGCQDIGFWSGPDFGKCGVLTPGDFDGISYADLETAPTREEAAARLWMSVTGRTVTSG